MTPSRWATAFGLRAALSRSEWVPSAASTFALVALGSGSSGCSPRPAPPPAVVDCATPNAAYDFEIVETYDENPPHYGWYGYGDLTPGASWVGESTNNPPVVPIENGGPCGSGFTSAPSQSALFLSGHGFQDYGNGWGTYDIGVYYPSTRAGPQAFQPDGSPCLYSDGDAGICPISSAADYDGLAFWARSFDPADGPTTKGFTLSINDGATETGIDSTCVNYDAGYMSNGSVQYTAPVGGSTGNAGGSTVSAVPPANACGNGFAYPLLTTGEWQLYAIPWGAFSQLARPNRIATGFDPATFLQVVVAAPKEAISALWIDSLGFYKAKTRDGGD